eukprot:scaffold318377_cov40-Tisochrysis_lutea.AAC.1
MQKTRHAQWGPVPPTPTLDDTRKSPSNKVGTELSQCTKGHMEARVGRVVLSNRAGPRGGSLHDPYEDAHAQHQRQPRAAIILERGT